MSDDRLWPAGANQPVGWDARWNPPPEPTGATLAAGNAPEAPEDSPGPDEARVMRYGADLRTAVDRDPGRHSVYANRASLREVLNRAEAAEAELADARQRIAAVEALAEEWERVRTSASPAPEMAAWTHWAGARLRKALRD